MWSFWERESFLIEPDLVVVGSGIVGLNAAIHFKKSRPTAKVLIIEAGHLPAGASTKNAGFACFGSPSEILMDLENTPEAEVIKTVKARWEGLNYLKELLGESTIGFESPGSYELFLQKNQDSFELCSSKIDYLNSITEEICGFKPYSIDDGIADQSGFHNMHGAIKIEGEGQIHTGNMMSALIRLARSLDIQIWNGLMVTKVDLEESSFAIETNQGVLKSKTCIVATNGFAQHLLPDLEVEPARAQVLITKPIEGLKFQGTYHLDNGYFYFRNIGNRVLLGGGRNLDFENERSSKQVLNLKLQQVLDAYLKEIILPNHLFEIDMRWTGIMGIGKSKMPIVERLDSGIIAAVKLGGMGIAIGSHTGKRAAEIALFNS